MNDLKDVPLSEIIPQSIGTQNEKPIHAALKRYYEPHTDSHEVRIGRYIADIVGENGIIEIQTGSFDRMNKKLTALLEVAHVTVVYPICVKKQIVNTDTNRRYGSPKKRNKWHFLIEAGKLRELLLNSNLSFILCFHTAIEYRSGSGRKTIKQRTELDKITDEIMLRDTRDWTIFTEELPETFTAKAFSAVSGLRGIDNWSALMALVSAGVLERSEKQGNAFIYRKLI